MTGIIIEKFRIGNVLVPEFIIDLGVPTCIIWPESFDLKVLELFHYLLTNQLNGTHVEMVTWNFKRKIFPSRITVKELIKSKMISEEFIIASLKDVSEFSVQSLGVTEKFLINLAFAAKKSDVIVYSTSGIDPKGCKKLITCGRYLSKSHFVFHIEFTTNTPNSFVNWQLVNPHYVSG